MIERLTEVPQVPAVEVEATGDFVPGPGGFLELRCDRLRLQWPSGERSEVFDYFHVERRSLDAVVVAPFFFAPPSLAPAESAPAGFASAGFASAGFASAGDEQSGPVDSAPVGSAPWVVLRSAVRPPVSLRADAEAGDLPVIHGFWEIPAGLIEADEESPVGQRRAALRELLEETGLSIDDSALQALGPLSYPCPGVIGERQTFFCVEVDPNLAAKPPLDGSVLESAGRLIAVPLDAALAGVNAGLVGDMKSELCLRRLKEKLER